jgi:hypothetical protein
MSNSNFPPISTLGEISSVVGSYIYWLMSQIQPDRWTNQNQVIYSYTEDWDSNAYWYMKQNNVAALSYPFAAITRVPEIKSVDFGNGLRPWDIDFYDRYTPDTYVPGTTPTTVKTVRVRRVLLGYFCNIWDGSFAGSEKIIDRIIALGMRGPKRVDYTSQLLQIPVRVTVEFSIPKRSRVPSKDDIVAGTGNVFGVSCPLAVVGVVGSVFQQPYILNQELKVGTSPIDEYSQSGVLNPNLPDFIIYDTIQNYDGSLTVVTGP